MSCNVKLLERIQRCEDEYGSVSAAPDLGSIHEVADREPEQPNYTDKTLKLREMIYRGFEVSEIVERLDLSRSYVNTVRHRMKQSPGFEYQSTRDDLIQLKYNFDHGGKKTSVRSVSGAMRRERTWVKSVVNVLRRNGKWRDIRD